MADKMKLVECVPNFSEGRRPDVIHAIEAAVCSVPGVTVLDCENDQNHNRMVLTFVGDPEAVKQAALASSQVAIQQIDLTKHTGEHPRMGAVDVVPFVPLRGVSMEDCVVLANDFAREYSRRFDVPVYMYESAAKVPARKDLAYVRRGQFEGLREAIRSDPVRYPDYGPKRIHPTAGATAVGARSFLIAYNINLASTDVSIAKKIAHRIRERDGGLPSVKALGFELKDRNLTQVSMNLTDFNATSISKAFEAVSDLSNEFGVKVAESEIVGLVPLEAINQAAVSYLRLTNFGSNQIIENKLLQIAWAPYAQKKSEGSEDFSNRTVSEFIDSVASKDPTPGGGTVSALSGALAAALVLMVCRLTLGKKGYEKVQEPVSRIASQSEELVAKLKNLANQDALSFSKVSAALVLPKSDEQEKERRSAILNSALKEASLVPAETVRASYQVYRLATEIHDIGNKNARSDAFTARELSRAAVLGAWNNVMVNLDSLKEPAFSEGLKTELFPIVSEIT